MNCRLSIQENFACKSVLCSNFIFATFAFQGATGFDISHPVVPVTGAVLEILANVDF